MDSLNIGIKKKNYKAFSIIIIVLIIFRIWLAMSLPLRAWGDAGLDDFLLIKYAHTIASGQWLGEYGMTTFLKGVTYPLFVAAFYLLNIPYSAGLIGIYIAACLVAVKAFSPLIKNKNISGIIFILLLYSPAMFQDDYVQRLYRNAIIPAFVLLVFGFQIGTYLRLGRGVKGVSKWVIGESISLALFWYIREDSVWILPFYLVSLAVIYISIHKDKLYKGFLKKALFIMPIISIVIYALLIGGINYKYYGVFGGTELRLYVPYEYNVFMNYLEDIEPEEEIEGVEVTRDAIMQACDASPTLNTVRQNIENIYDNRYYLWANGDIKGEVKGSYYWWAIRHALSDSGIYRSPETTNEFLVNVNSQLKTAFENGELKAKGNNDFVSTVFSDMPLIISKMFESNRDIVNYRHCIAIEATGVGNNTDAIRTMEVMTGGRVIYPSDTKIKGWIFANDDSSSVSIELADKNGNKISDVQMLESKDVYDYYLKENAKNARFDINVSKNYKADDLTLAVYLDDSLYKTISLSQTDHYKDGSITYNIEEVSEDADIMPHDGRYAVNISNCIISVYRFFSWMIFALAVLSYLYVLVVCVKKIKAKVYDFNNRGIILTALLLSYIVLLFVVCFRYRIAWNSDLRWFYLTGTFPLMQLFKYYSISAAASELKKIMIVKKRM